VWEREGEREREMYLFYSVTTVRSMDTFCCARMAEKRKAYRLLVGKPEGKRPLERPRHRWVDNIKMDLLVIGWGGVDWIGLAQDRDKWRALVNAVVKPWVP
jgi:hypothetical protein